MSTVVDISVLRVNTNTAIIFSFVSVVHRSHSNERGCVLAVGEGDTGQLGLGPDVMEKAKPGKVTMPADVVQVTAGGMHTLCLTEEGQVCNISYN